MRSLVGTLFVELRVGMRIDISQYGSEESTETMSGNVYDMAHT